jgi:hypothetical protein
MGGRRIPPIFFIPPDFEVPPKTCPFLPTLDTYLLPFIPALGDPLSIPFAGAYIYP